MNAAPGEIFVIRNVANLIPPFQKDKKTYHGTSAALEFAVNILKVENIIILGHSQCAGINTLANLDKNNKDFSFVNSWVRIASKAWHRVIKEHPSSSHQERISLCEKESIVVSYENLMSYPWVKSKFEEKYIEIFAWHFDLHTGYINSYNPIKDSFEKLVM